MTLCFRYAAWLAAGAWTLAAQPAPAAHFHHIHLNSTDPAAAAAFYPKHFDCEERQYQGGPAVWAQKSWLLFNKVEQPPPFEITSAVWHFGWGAENMPAEYQRQLDMGTTFQTPLTDISDLANTKGFYYAYVYGPDHVLIELNTANHHRFGHLHLLSDDPVGAGEWYIEHFGAVSRRKPPYPREERFYKGFQVAPMMSMLMDNVSILIYPVGYARKAWPDLWANRKSFDSTKGRVVDHIAFSVDDLAATKERLRKEGVKFASDGFIEGPDRLRIELVEERGTAKP